MLECLKNLKPKYCLTFVTGLVECLLFAGTVFGWTSLVFLMKTEGFFSCGCVNTTGVNETLVKDCSKQDEQFSLVFTIASFLSSFLTLPNGIIFDCFGTTVTRLLAISLCTMGSLMFAFATPALSNLLFAALPLMAVGGFMLLITNMQVGNLFFSQRSTIITLYGGVFNSSSFVFLVIKLVFETGISLRASFLFLSACSVILLLRTFFLLPTKVIPYPLPAEYTYGKTFGRLKTLSQEHLSENVIPEMMINPPSTDIPMKQERTFRECLLSRLYLFHLVWMSVIKLRHFIFIGTLNPMLQRLTGGELSLVSQYTNAFALTQLCSVMCAPFNGLIMDRHKRNTRAEGETEEEADLRASVLSLFLTALQCLLFSICATIPYLPLQYLTFILQVINFSFLYGGGAAFISVAFPSIHFGKLFGTAAAVSAVFSLLQYPCFALVEDVLDGDPLYVNIALTLFSLLAFSHSLSTYLYCRSLASQRESLTVKHSVKFKI